MKTKYQSCVLDMREGRPFHILLRFSQPLYLCNLFQQSYHLADTLIAGNLLGDTVLAQIDATAALSSLITNLAFGLNNGLALTISRHFGAGAQRPVRIYLSPSELSPILF